MREDYESLAIGKFEYGPWITVVLCFYLIIVVDVDKQQADAQSSGQSAASGSSKNEVVLLVSFFVVYRLAYGFGSQNSYNTVFIIGCGVARCLGRSRDQDTRYYYYHPFIPCLYLAQNSYCST